MSDFRVEIIRSLDEWGRISEIWNDLLINTRSNTLFLTWEWLSSWAEVFWSEGKKFFILAIYKREALVGIAPWYIHSPISRKVRMQVIEFLGLPESGADYLDVFAKRGEEKEVAGCLYEFLMQQARDSWDFIRLSDIRGNSFFLLYFSERMRSEGKYFEITQGSYCPFVNLPKSKEEFITSLSHNRRKQFRSNLKTLLQHGVLRHRCFEEENAENGLREFVALYQKVKKGGDDKFLSFLETFTRKSRGLNWVQIDMLSLDGLNLVGLFHLKYNHNLYSYAIATDKAVYPKVGMGSLLLQLCIEKAIQAELAIYDFLKGAEDYKFHWANNCNSSFNMVFTSKKIKTIPITLGILAKYAGKFLLR